MSDYPPCKTCEHYSHTEDTFGREQKRCTLHGSHDGSAEHDSRATAQDAESYSAWLEVDEDFGCADHSALSGDE